MPAIIVSQNSPGRPFLYRMADVAYGRVPTERRHNSLLGSRVFRRVLRRRLFSLALFLPKRSRSRDHTDGRLLTNNRNKKT